MFTYLAETNLSIYFEELLTGFPFWQTSSPTLQMGNEIGTSKEIHLKKKYLTGQTLMSDIVPQDSFGNSTVSPAWKR
jgi:hypothetical protein